MSSTRRTKRRDKRNGESSTLSGTGGSHISSDSESPPGRRCRRKSGRLLMKKKIEKSKSGEQDYDGDKENSSENTCPSSISPLHTDEYDFNEVDVIPVIEKSSKEQKPVKKSKVLQKKIVDKISNRSSKTTMKNPEMKKSQVLSSTPIYSQLKSLDNNKKQPVGRQKRKMADVSTDSNQKKRMKKIIITPILCTPTTDSSSEKTQSCPTSLRRSKRKVADSINITPVLPRGDNQADSGMFVSPPPRKLLRLAAKDTSTPSDMPKSNPSLSTEKKMGFDESSSLLFSPVEKVFTPSPTSDYGSIVNSMEQFSIQEFEIPKPVFEIEDPEPELKLNKSINKGYNKVSKKKIKKCKTRISISKVEAWAEKVNEDFDEIEKFELSIEG